MFEISTLFRFVLLCSINDAGSRVAEMGTTMGVETTLLNVFLVSARITKDRQVEDIASFAAA